MLSIAKNTNITILTNPLLFNLLTLNSIIQKVSASNIERIFNSHSVFKEISLLRIKSWLTKIWSPQITIDLLLTHYHKTKNYTLIFHFSQLAKNNIIPSILSQISNYPLSIPKNIPLIYEILPPNPNNLIINSLKNNKLLFVEQVTMANNTHLLSWNNIYLCTNKFTKGCQLS